MLVVAATLALILAFAGGDQAYASFNPTGAITVVDPAPGAHSDIVADFSIQSPDVNTDALITFIPPEFTITTGSEIPDGAIAGMRTSTATFGLISGACNSSLQVDSTGTTSFTAPVLASIRKRPWRDSESLPWITNSSPDIQRG